MLGIEVFQYISAILFLAILGQWISWRFNMPALLVLLLLGLGAGPGLSILPSILVLNRNSVGVLSAHGFENVPGLSGSEIGLYTFVVFSCGLLLFEAGLNLRWKELRPIVATVVPLALTTGLFSWAASAFLLHRLFAIPPHLAMLFGSLFISSGASLGAALMRRARPIGSIEKTLRWEGMLTDVIGAFIAIGYFGVLVTCEGNTIFSLYCLTKIVLGAGLIGVGLGYLARQMIRLYLVPDYLQNPLIFVFSCGAFVCAEFLHPWSGFLALIFLGGALSNQKDVAIDQLLQFKEELRVLVISSFCVIIPMQVTAQELNAVDGRHLLFIFLLCLVIRPLSVFLATWRKKRNIRERVLLAAISPRGSLLIALGVIFLANLDAVSRRLAEPFLPLGLTLVIVSVAFYTLFTPLVARKLGLVDPSGEGVLIVGAQPWAREIALTLYDEGVSVLLVDTNGYNVAAARREGLKALQSSIFVDPDVVELPISGLGKLCAITSNDEVNTLAVMQFSSTFGRENVFKLAPDDEQVRVEHRSRRGSFNSRILYSTDITYRYLESLFSEGASVEVITLSREYGLQSLVNDPNRKIVPLALISATGDLQPFVAGHKLAGAIGSRVVFIVQDLDRD